MSQLPCAAAGSLRVLRLRRCAIGEHLCFAASKKQRAACNGSRPTAFRAGVQGGTQNGRRIEGRSLSVVCAHAGSDEGLAAVAEAFGSSLRELDVSGCGLCFCVCFKVLPGTLCCLVRCLARCLIWHLPMAGASHCYSAVPVCAPHVFHPLVWDACISCKIPYLVMRCHCEPTLPLPKCVLSYPNHVKNPCPVVCPLPSQLTPLLLRGHRVCGCSAHSLAPIFPQRTHPCIRASLLAASIQAPCLPYNASHTMQNTRARALSAGAAVR